jgi:hypothetical protein
MVARTRKRAKKYSPKKLTSRKKPRKSDYVKTLEKRVKELELKQLKQPENIQEINKRVEALEQEKTEKPVSGHVEAGRKWSQSPKGEDWKNDIKNTQKLLDTKLQIATGNKNISASGSITRKIAGLIRRSKNPQFKQDPIDIEKTIDETIQKIIKNKEKKVKNEMPEQLEISEETLQPETQYITEEAVQPDIPKPLSPTRIINEQNKPSYLIGGFFDDSSDDDN